MSAICTTCSTSTKLMEFVTARDLSEHIKSNHSTRPEGWEKPKRIKLSDVPKLMNQEAGKEVPKVEEPVLPVKARPIELEYRFSGDCPDCKNPIDTILVGVTPTQHTAVAYCPHCKRQFKQVSVIPISEQAKGKFLFDESK